MPFDAYFALWAFVILMVSTPGPANLLVMSAGASHGFRATIPFMIGLATGKLGINILLAFGFGALLLAYPLLNFAMKFLSAFYLSYLALRGWNNGAGNAKSAAASIGKPAGFFAGCVVHPMSPKAWLMATLAYSQFIIAFDGVFERYALAPLSFLVAQIIFHSLWCFGGVILQRQFGASLLLNRALIMLTLAVVAWALFQ